MSIRDIAVVTQIKPRQGRVATGLFTVLICLNVLAVPVSAQLKVLPRNVASWGQASFSPDGKWLAVATATSSTEVAAFSVGANVIAAVQDSVADGTVIKAEKPRENAALPKGAGISIWNLETGELAGWYTHEALGDSVPKAVNYSPSGKLLGAIASNTNDDALLIWNTESGKVVQTIKSDAGYGFGSAFVFLPGESRAAVTNPNGSIDVFSLKKGTLLQEFRGNETSESLILSPNGKQLASGFSLWDVESEKLIAKHDDYPKVELIAFAKNGDALYGCDMGDRRLDFWETGKNRRSQPFMQAMQASNYGDIFCLTISNNIVITGSRDGIIGIWDTMSRTLLGRFEVQDQSVYWLAVSHDGRKLVSSGVDAHLSVWNLADYLRERAEKKAVGLTRYMIGGRLNEELLIDAPPLPPSGKRVSEDDELRLGQDLLVRNDMGQWYRGVVVKLLENGKVVVHRVGLSNRENLLVTISRLQYP